MPLFRKKPVVIEAVRWTGNMTDVEGLLARSKCDNVTQDLGSPSLFIPTLEGVHEAKVGDWIIKGVAGELYPCKPEIFAETYEPA